MIKKNVILLKRKNGFIVQYKEWSIDFYLYSLRRILHFVFDFIFCYVLLFVFGWIFNMNLYLSTFICMISSWIYNGWSIYLGKNKTLGMLLAKLCIVNFDGSKIKSIYKNIPRIILSSFYIVPFFGWFLVCISFFTTWITKGVSLIDLITKTQVFSKEKSIFFENIYKKTEREFNDK